MNYITKYTDYTVKDLRFKSGVYTITNSINNKMYVGGAKDFYDRFRIHIGELLHNKHHNSHLQNAVNKYSIENFKFEILEEYPLDITFPMEDYWIDILDVTNKDRGYNINKRAGTRLGAVLSQETKDKISKSLTGRRSLNRNTTGESMSQETKDKIRDNSPFKKKIIQLDLNNNFIKEWEGIHIAAKELGLHCTNMCQTLKGKYKTNGGFVFVYKDIYDSTKDYSTTQGKQSKLVGKYDLNDNLLEIFPNTIIAAKSVNGFQSNINSLCNNATYIRLKTYKGFKWKYYEEKN